MAAINDLVLVHIDEKPAFYARIEDVEPDSKPGWWQVSLLVLTVPLQQFTWILDEFQLEGAAFTMGGTPVRLDPVVLPEAAVAAAPPPGNGRPSGSGGGKVVSLADRRKK